MRIAILAHTLFPIREPYAGGMEMITHLLVKKLMERGHFVDLYAVRDSDPNLNIIPYASIDLGRGALSGTNHSQGEKPDRFECFQLADALLKIATGDYDIVHNNSQHYLPVLLGENIKVPFITTLHIPAFEFLHYAFNFLDAQPRQVFTAVSQHLSQVYRQLGISAKTIYNGIDLSFWRFSNRSEKKALLWFGRICPEKGTHQAIALALRMNTKLYLAGPISNVEYYQELVEPHIDGELIMYMGHLKHKALNALIGRCAVTLFLSTWEEPYGLAIAESLACGTPVIAWEKGASSEILTERCGVLVPENDMDALEKAVDVALGLERSDCRERAEDFCSIDAMVSGYECLYEQLVFSVEQDKVTML